MGAKGEKVVKVKVEQSDVTYRKIEALNYSSIVKFNKSPVKFFEEYILGNESDDEDTVATLIGNVVDDVILTCQGNMEEFEQMFDSRYALYQGEPTTAQGFFLADELFRITKSCIVDGEITRTFEDRFREAFEKVQRAGKYKGKTVANALDDFRSPNKAGSVPEHYFETKLASIGKMVISDGIKARALQIASNALLDPFTAEEFNFPGKDENIEKLPKFVIEFPYICQEGKIKGKVEVDLLVINHLTQRIYPKDLKTTYDNTMFTANYLKNSYYIQAVWYTLAVQWWAKENGFKNYKVEPYEFIVLDTSLNNRRPIIRTLSDRHIKQGYEGFTSRGITYKGVKELVDAIIWADGNDIWNCSKQVHENDGRLALEDFS